MFSPRVYAQRRARLADRLDSGLVLLPGNTTSPMNFADNPHPFRQDSTFLYYFGIDAPGLAGVVDVDAGTSTLVGEDPGLDAVVWMGPQPSTADRAEAAGTDDHADWGALAGRLEAAVRNGRRVHFPPPYRDAHRRQLADLLGLQPGAVDTYASEALVRAVVDQRSRKSEAEVDQLETALEATAEVHETAMQMAAPGTVEREIAGRLTGIARAHGGELSFPPTCSVRGEVLHNHAYGNTLAEGDLLLVDAGATSPLHYAGDVTRVTPVGGSFTERQRDLYRAVLDSQAAAIDRMEPGAPFVDVHLEAARVLTDRLKSIGLMSGRVDDAVEAGAHALFFPHGLGHMLGLDVHDMEALDEDIVGYAEDQTRSTQFGLNALRLARPLEPGFTVTVEPGCYFIPSLVERWAGEGRHERFINYDTVDDFVGIGGIRIEDDVLVTDDGTRILGPPIPRSIDEVEAMAGG
jgi:Xaa-Pro aminopeptidase